ncbi:MAG: excinuclease ABC subunit UvrA [Bacteroidetes bacterium]|nr:excinuclease ABC subunit UvrA [Bacteroidota bacterium]
MVTLSTLTQPGNILIKNAHQHNLKHLDISFRHGSFSVVTGVSGSGKSSLVFDTLFAEGQRRYVESLSSYARQFMGRMKKPAVDYILGLCPAVAIEQKVNTRNPRSTVATSTEIYDYLKLLFSRAGHTFSPKSGREVKRNDAKDVVQYVLAMKPDTVCLVLAPLQDELTRSRLELILQNGFSRIYHHGEILKIAELVEAGTSLESGACLVVDRVVANPADEELESRLYDSAETAFWEGKGTCLVVADGGEPAEFSNRFEMDGIVFEVPTRDFLSFNNPYGACRRCEGFGSVLGIDEDLVIPDKGLSVYEGAVAPWKGDTMGEWREDFIRLAAAEGFPIHRPYRELSVIHKELLWKGSKKLPGIDDFFKYVEEKSYKIQYRVLAARYRGKTMCPDCKGTRLRPDAAWVKMVAQNASAAIPEKISLQEVLLMPVHEALAYFNGVKYSEQDETIAARILAEIRNRLRFLENVGLGYLSLNRLSNTLSGGESQRINLATSLGSNLTGSLYVLDEPSIGLHSRDTERLIEVLKELQREGNTVLVVEHDEDVMKAADFLADIGPLAGSAGGKLMFAGNYTQMLQDENSLTGKYLSGRESIPVPEHRRPWKHSLKVLGAEAHNLKNIDVEFPLETLTVVTGVSGSGKTTLVKQILYPALSKELGQFVGTRTGTFGGLEGAKKMVKAVELVDQNPIGKSSRSNPVTYVKAYDEVRDLYASQPLSKFKGFKPAHYSFNVDGGRCDNCQGEGETVIEMQFMADIKLPCEVCGGKRFRNEVLEVEYKGKNIYDVLEMTVDEAVSFFADEKNIADRLKPLQDVGLGYVKLGQGSNTLSGGEAQRVKLAFYLSKANPHKEGGTVFIFDEPTTGLHFHDIKKLLASFNALIQKGNTVICIEHNLDVVKCADWVIDMGPEAGDAGGDLVFAGLPEDLLKVPASYTGKYLADKLKAKN